MGENNFADPEAARGYYEAPKTEEAPEAETGEQVSSAEAGARVVESLRNKMSGFGEKASRVGKVLGKFGLRMLAPKHLASEIRQSASDKANEMYSSGKEKVSSAYASGKEAISERYQHISEATQTKVSEISERASSAMERADNWVGDKFNDAYTAVESAGTRSVEATSKAITSMRDRATQAWTTGVLEPVDSARAFITEKRSDAVEWDKTNKIQALVNLRTRLDNAIKNIDSRISNMQGPEQIADPEAERMQEAA